MNTSHIRAHSVNNSAKFRNTQRTSDRGPVKPSHQLNISAGDINNSHLSSIKEKSSTPMNQTAIQKGTTSKRGRTGPAQAPLAPAARASTNPSSRGAAASGIDSLKRSLNVSRKLAIEVPSRSNISSKIHSAMPGSTTHKRSNTFKTPIYSENSPTRPLNATINYLSNTTSNNSSLQNIAALGRRSSSNRRRNGSMGAMRNVTNTTKLDRNFFIEEDPAAVQESIEQFQKGKLLLSEKNYKMAQKYFSQAISLDANNFDALFYRGVAFLDSQAP